MVADGLIRVVTNHRPTPLHQEQGGFDLGLGCLGAEDDREWHDRACRAWVDLPETLRLTLYPPADPPPVGGRDHAGLTGGLTFPPTVPLAGGVHVAGEVTDHGHQTLLGIRPDDLADPNQCLVVLHVLALLCV